MGEKLERIIQVPEGDPAQGAYWEFRYSETPIALGQTQVDWGLYKGGREYDGKNPTYLGTIIDFTISSLQKISGDGFTEDKENNCFKYNWGANIQTRPNSTGSNQPHCSYQSQHNSTPTKKGSFIIFHDSEGSAQISITVDAQIYTNFNKKGLITNIPITKNSPRTPCYWSPDAAITIDRTYIAPGKGFTVSWSGANPGIDNKIVGFRVYYKIAGEEEKYGETTINNNSHIFTLDANATRGKKIEITVGIIGENLTVPVDKSAASSFVNILPEQLKIENYTGKETGDTFSFFLEKVSFTYTLPIKPNQNIEAQIKVGDNGQYSSYSDQEISDDDWPSGANKKLYLRAWDGEEGSSEQVYTLTRNTQPTASVTYDTNSFMLTINPPEKTEIKTYTNELVFLQDGNELNRVNIIGTQELIDVRTLFADGVTNGTEYTDLKAQLWCADNIDTFTFESEEKFVLIVPKFEIKGTELTSYYVDGNKDTITFTSSSVDNWVFSGVESIGQGKELTRIIMSGGQEGPEFYVNFSNSDPGQKLYTIKNLEFDFSIENNEYKPYSQKPQFSTQFSAISNWAMYGLEGLPQLTFWLSDGTNAGSQKTGAHTEATNDNTLSYIFSQKSDYYDIAEDFKNTSSNLELHYSYKTVYNTEVELTATNQITLDFTEPTKQVGTSWAIYANPSGKNNCSIENWDCIKEGMLLQTNFQVAATTTPTAWLEQSVDGTNWKKFYDFTVSASGEDSEKFNIDVPIYSFTSTDMTPIGQITEDTESYIRIVVQTDSKEKLEEEYLDRKFNFAQHIAPLINFTDISYQQGIEGSVSQITGRYNISLNGSNKETTNTYKCNIKIGNESSSIEANENDGTISFDYNFPTSQNYIYVAPILTTSLSAYYSNGEERFYAFESEYETVAETYEYIVCYNISPTIAYRPNHLGINTNNPSGDNALLDINSYNNHNIIYLRGTGHQALVDLTTGAIINFVIDCGSWDGTSGGIIPGSGQSQSIEIGDLVPSDYYVVFEGGSATEGI